MYSKFEYDLFISYARLDNENGWVSWLFNTICDDFQGLSGPIRVFFDTQDIRSGQDWEERLLRGLSTSRVLLVCLSPNYLRSPWCQREWREFARMRARRPGGGDAVTGAYFVDLGGDENYGDDIAAWRHEVERVQLADLKPWFFEGVAALQHADLRERVGTLGQGVHEQVTHSLLAKQAPGNLRRYNPYFVGRLDKLATLSQQLAGLGTAGVVTAVHGVGGMGKTELAVTFAHAYAHKYQGGTWQVDAEGKKDILEAISDLANWTELDLKVPEQDRRDPRRLGRLVLARLAEISELAGIDHPTSNYCLLLLDNVSESQLLDVTQLATIPHEPWLHVVVTTRLGPNDVAASGTKGSVAMLEVGRLDDQDALELLRERQPARDSERLKPDFSNTAEEAAGRQLVALLDGYTLAVEQAAAYLGVTEVQPSDLLTELQEEGAAALDYAMSADSDSAIRGQIQHEEKLVGSIVDQSLERLSKRGRVALAYASLLPPDTIPWSWLRDLSEPSDRPSLGRGLGGLAGLEIWPTTRRMLEGRRLLTLADDPGYARLHRVVQSHLRRGSLITAETEDRLDDHLRRISLMLIEAQPPDIAQLKATASALSLRLRQERDQLADSALWLFDRVSERLDAATVAALAQAVLDAQQRRCNEIDDADRQRALAVSLTKVGDVRLARGESDGALDAYHRSLHMAQRLAHTEPHITHHLRDVSIGFERVGNTLLTHRDYGGALDAYTQSVDIRRRLVEADPDNSDYQRALCISLIKIGDAQTAEGESSGALDAFNRAMTIAERLSRMEPDDTGHQFDLSIILDRVGNIRTSGRQHIGALDAYGQSLDIRQRLADGDPDNTDYQRALSVSLTKVGAIRAIQNDPDGALDVYSEAESIHLRLTAADPNNIDYQHALSFVLSAIGDACTAKGDVDGATDAYTRALEIRQRLAADHPSNIDHQRGVWIGSWQVAAALESHGDNRAEEYWLRAFTVLDAMERSGEIPDSDRANLDELRRRPDLR